MGVFSQNDSQLLGIWFFHFYFFKWLHQNEKNIITVCDNPTAGPVPGKREQNFEHIFNYFRVGMFILSIEFSVSYRSLDLKWNWIALSRSQIIPAIRFWFFWWDNACVWWQIGSNVRIQSRRINRQALNVIIFRQIDFCGWLDTANQMYACVKGHWKKEI